jgi:amino acid transporter
VDSAAPKLHRTLGTRDLVLFNLAAGVGLRWIALAAQIGPSSLALWVLGFLLFFLPLGLVVAELSSRIPGQGGLYLWSKAAFGDVHGFIAGWSYVISNIFYFPSMLLFGAGVFLYVGGGDWLALGESATYNWAFCLLALWLATLLNILGLKRAKWLNNIGGITTPLVGALVLLGGVLALHAYGAATPITAPGLLPHFTSMASLATFAAIAFAYDGLELAPLMGGEIKDPQRTIPRALLISGGLIVSIYVLGTLSLLVALPAEEIDTISGIPQALEAVGSRVGIPVFGVLAAALLTISQVGGLGAWVTGTARLPFVFGIDRYLPKAFAAVHPRSGSPHVALLTQGVLTTIVLIGAISGSTIHEAFALLIDMTVILAFVPLLYMFAALPILRRRAMGSNSGVTLVPGGPIMCWVTAGAGFAVTLLAIVVAMIPPEDNTNPSLFLIKVLGGCATMIGVGLAFYARGTRRLAADARRPPAAAEAALPRGD